MAMTRGQKVQLLQDAVARAKREWNRWPEFWRTPICKLAVENTDIDVNGLNAFISYLNAEEWDSLELPDEVQSGRPFTALRPAYHLNETERCIAFMSVAVQKLGYTSEDYFSDL